MVRGAATATTSMFFGARKAFIAFKRGGGIDFAGAVNVADALQIGHQFLHQFEIAAQTGYSSDMPVTLVPEGASSLLGTSLAATG